MKVIITGATGFVGARLVRQLIEKGHRPLALTRNAQKARKKLPSECEVLEWSPGEQNPLNFDPKEIANVEAAINLAGENISEKRWSEEQKQKILNSRLQVTEALVQSLKQHAPQCEALVSASAIGFYRVNQSETLTEEAGPGEGFLPEVCQRWESEAQKIGEQTRLVILRIGVVLGPEGGALGKLLPLFNLGLGGKVSNGGQMMSWIHVDDLVRIFTRAIEDQHMKGIYNAVSPYPVNNKTFTQALAKALGRPALFPVPAFALKLLMGEMSTIVLDSQTLSSQKLQTLGFEFQFPTIDEATKDLIQQYRQEK